MADTELQALVVKLEADISSFKSDLMRGQKAVEDSAKRMGDSISKFSEQSQSDFGDFNALIGTTAKLFAAGGVLGAGIMVAKKALDTVFEAENIRAYNAQFEMLASNAGVAGNALKEGLMKAADGLVDDTDLIKQANQSLIAMGSVTKDLPQVMELARKATAAFGGSAASNFDTMATAIANGNTRALKNLGIVIDQDAAYKRFAESIGKTAEELSQTGKQQAMMNAVLERGSIAYKGVDDSVIKAQTSWQQFKVTLGQIGETATLAFEKLAGPTVRNMLKGVGDMAIDAKRAITASFGEGSEKAQAQVETLRMKLMDMKATLIDLEQKKLGKVIDLTPGDTISRMSALQRQLKGVEDQLKSAEAQLPKTAEGHKTLAKSVDASKDSYIKLKEIQDTYVEAGQKIAKDMTEFSPETVMKTNLEQIQAMRELDLISSADYYAMQSTLLQQKLDSDSGAVQAAYAKGKIDEVTYQSTIMSLQSKAQVDHQKLEAEQLKADKATHTQRLADTQTALSTISTLTNSHSRELFNIGKAASIANATISMYEGVAKAWALGPILGPILAPLVAIAGAAQISGIASQQFQFAEGGTIPGFGFSDNVPIMGTPGEEIIDRSTSERFRAFMDRFESGEMGGGSGSGRIEISLKDNLIEFIEAKILDRQNLNISLLGAST